MLFSGSIYCNKKLYDFEKIEKYPRCKSICLKSNFHKNVNRKDGVISICKICMNKYIKEYLKTRLKTDVSFRLIRNKGQRIHHALKGKSKSFSTIDILGIAVETYRKWVEYQMSPKMNWRNIETDHVKPLCFFDVSIDKELKEAFSWKNTQPLLKKVISKKGLIIIS